MVKTKEYLQQQRDLNTREYNRLINKRKNLERRIQELQLELHDVNIEADEANTEIIKYLTLLVELDENPK